MLHGFVSFLNMEKSDKFPQKKSSNGTLRMEALRPIDLDGSVQSVAAGSYHTCILRDVTGVTCFGSGVYGQLGDGSFSNIGDSPNEKLGGFRIFVKQLQSCRCLLFFVLTTEDRRGVPLHYVDDKYKYQWHKHHKQH